MRQGIHEYVFEIRLEPRMTSGSDLLDKVQILSISTEELRRQSKIRAMIYFTPNERNACCSKLNMPLSMEFILMDLPDGQSQTFQHHEDSSCSEKVLDLQKQDQQVWELMGISKTLLRSEYVFLTLSSEKPVHAKFLRGMGFVKPFDAPDFRDT